MKKILLLSFALAAIVGCTKNDGDSHKELTMSEKTLSMQIPATKQISVISPEEYAKNPNLVWTSTKPTVASVDQKGNITALTPGETKIYAFVSGMNMVTGYCDVKVSPKMATSLKITIDKTTLDAGQSVTATYAYSPSIDHSEVALEQSDSVGMKIVAAEIEIDKKTELQTGKLTFKALAPGKVKVKIYNIIDETTSDEIMLTINPIDMTSFKFKTDVKSIAMDAKMVKLETEILPKAAAYRNILYKSLNTNILQVTENGTLIPINEGVATILVSTDDNVTLNCDIEVTKGKEGSVKFVNKMMDLVVGNGVVEPEVTVSGSSSATLRIDGNYIPEKGGISQITIVNGTGVVAEFGKAGTGSARIIAETGVLDKNGKPIADSCIVNVIDVVDELVLPKPAYYTSDFDTKTTVVAYLNNFMAENITFKKAVLYITKENRKSKEDKVLQTIENINLNIDLGKVKSVSFGAQKTLQSEINGYRVKYTYMFNGAEYTVDRAVVKGNGASFVAPK